MEVTVLGREEIKKAIRMDRVIEEVAEVYRLKAKGETVVWPLVSYDFVPEGGVMDIRSGYVKGKQLHGLKMLNNFPANVGKGLPPFNGMLLIFDSNTGLPLGVMDASYITCMRTGAAGALGAKALARPDSKCLTVLGAGKQAAYQIAAALILMPQLERIYVADPLNQENAERFAREIPKRLLEEFHIDPVGTTEFAAAPSLKEAIGASDIVVTLTPARSPVIRKEWVKPGTHFSCIGSDMEGKQEIDSELFRGARIFADDKPQCMRVGEMELPLKNGVIQESDITGELGQLLAGTVSGRTDDRQTTIFDATGLAMLDLVTGKAAIDAAREQEIGLTADI